MSNRTSVLYQVSVSCLFFAYQDNELKLLVRCTEDRQLLFPETPLEANRSLDDTAVAMAQDFFGGEDPYVKQIKAFQHDTEEGQSNLLGIAYYGLVLYDTRYEQADSEYRWVSLKKGNFSPLQKDLAETALKRIRKKIPVEPIAFRMIPELFTLSLLQNLYECLFDMPVDKRNFRKRVNEMYFIEQTEMIDKLSSKRGAHLYSFNPELFRKSRIGFKLY